MSPRALSVNVPASVLRLMVLLLLPLRLVQKLRLLYLLLSKKIPAIFIIAALPPIVATTDSMGHSFNINIAGGALQTASASLSSKRVGLGYIHQSMFCYVSKRSGKCSPPNARMSIFIKANAKYPPPEFKPWKCGQYLPIYFPN